ncbi:hypothetical protein ADUPG1_010839, partial [Aduncisulcus paluster]
MPKYYDPPVAKLYVIGEVRKKHEQALKLQKRAKKRLDEIKKQEDKRIKSVKKVFGPVMPVSELSHLPRSFQSAKALIDGERALAKQQRNLTQMGCTNIEIGRLCSMAERQFELGSKDVFNQKRLMMMVEKKKFKSKLKKKKREKARFSSLLWSDRVAADLAVESGLKHKKNPHGEDDDILDILLAEDEQGTDGKKVFEKIFSRDWKTGDYRWENGDSYSILSSIGQESGLSVSLKHSNYVKRMSRPLIPSAQTQPPSHYSASHKYLLNLGDERDILIQAKERGVGKTKNEVSELFRKYGVHIQELAGKDDDEGKNDNERALIQAKERSLYFSKDMRKRRERKKKRERRMEMSLIAEEEEKEKEEKKKKREEEERRGGGGGKGKDHLLQSSSSSSSAFVIGQFKSLRTKSKHRNPKLD